MAVPVFKTKTSYRAPLNKDYIPNPRILEQVVKLLISPDIDLSVCLKGESGSGKTEMVMYISHMMNWPLTIKRSTAIFELMSLKVSAVLMVVIQVLYTAIW